MQDKNAAPFFEFETNSNFDTTIVLNDDDEANLTDGATRTLNCSKPWLRLGRLMKVTYSYWPSSPIRMQITDEGSSLGENFSTKLQLRAASSLQGDEKRMKIGNLIRYSNGTKFVERCSFFYPNSIGTNCVDFFSPNSTSRFGWIKSGRDVADGGKIGFDSDSVDSPRFTTCPRSSGPRGILGLNIMDLVQEDNRTRSLITAAIGVLLVAMVVLIRLYFLHKAALNL
ncbi:capsid protein [Folsomia candida]|uniref:Capsid protein n=1 Tax=Folsomia candida TaxID=158441 RepID=A0A226DRP2_FOLCA|nr:capsid protein [Folsomia candida]